MYLYDQPHREWEIAPETLRRFIIGIGVAAGFVVLLNVLGSLGPNVWDRLQPTDVAQQIQTIGSM